MVTRSVNFFCLEVEMFLVEEILRKKRLYNESDVELWYDRTSDRGLATLTYIALS